MTATPSLPTFATQRVTNYWDTDGYDTGSLGLAEITNAGYFSDSTIPNNNPTPEHTFPSPQINIDSTNQYLCTDFLPGVSRPTKYVSRKPCLVVGSGVDHFAAVSLINSEADTLGGYPPIREVWLDNNVHDTYANALLPRAIGYSAALIDYFFRGTLGISDTGVLAVADGGDKPHYDVLGNQHQRFTMITAWVENTTPNEAIGPGTLTAVARYKIVPNYAPDLANYPPDAGAMMSIQEYTYSISAAEPVSAGDFEDGYYTSFSFNFAGNPIPAGITDLTLQVVFKGTIGNETDNAIAVGMLDIKEPTHFTVWNLTDMFPLKYPESTYTLYTFGQIVANITPTSQLFSEMDTTQNNSLEDEPLLKPINGTYTVSFWNGWSWDTAASVKIDAGQHIRLIVLAAQATEIYAKVQWEDPVSPGSEVFLFPGVVNQADQSGTY